MKYEERTEFAIVMIYKWGDDKSKDAAVRMATALSYNIDELIK